MANNESISKPADLVGMQAKYFVTGLKICDTESGVLLGLLNA